MHLMVQRLGLVKDIDKHLHLLKVHLPYHESDHVLEPDLQPAGRRAAAGGHRTAAPRRGLSQRSGSRADSDPTTAGDFTRRVSAARTSLVLQECINRARLAVWKVQPEGFLQEAFIDVDGTIAETYGECKEGMDISYKGIWGYAPLIVSLANTKEVLYLVNRPGNAASHSGSVEWIDRAVELVSRWPAASRFAGTPTLPTPSNWTAGMGRAPNSSWGWMPIPSWWSWPKPWKKQAWQPLGAAAQV